MKYSIHKLLAAAVIAGATSVFAAAEVPEGAEETPYGWTKIIAANNKAYKVVAFTVTGGALQFSIPQSVSTMDFLVVAGGGGGNGGGGGAGGMVVGTVDNVGGLTFDVTVGAGGAAGAAGGNSSFAADETTYVLAYGGGRANGYSGGSGAGGGKSQAGGAATSPSVNTDLVTSYTAYGHSGGTGATYGFGGGGGAGANGSGGTNNDNAGGAGLVCNITGENVYYAGGGNGGGNRKSASRIARPLGGGGQGGVNYTGYTNGTAGIDGLGGGGGGKYSSNATAGTGGSGIVIFRYEVELTMVDVPEIASKTCTGILLTADVDDTDYYTVVRNAGGVNVGDYEVELALKDTVNCRWKDTGSTSANKILTFTIDPMPNSWVTEPVVVSWSVEDNEPAQFIPPTAVSGTVTWFYDGDEGVIDRPTTPHEAHSVTYRVDANGNYGSYEQTYEYSIGYKFVGDAYRVPGQGNSGKDVIVYFKNTTHTTDDPMRYRIPEGVASFSYLVVGGGGGGGGNSQRNGGGGAGGLLASNDVEIVDAAGIDLAVVTGARGTGGSSSSGHKGGTSRLYVGDVFSAVAEGGGAGGGGGVAGGNGGCGGGAGAVGTAKNDIDGGIGSIGGNGGASPLSVKLAGGGGGMGGPGANGSGIGPGAGGPGVQNDITGEDKWYCAGGGGSTNSNGGGERGMGGEGGGGNGAYCVSNQSQGGGNASTYGSGGGGAWSSTGGNGYQGIVIIRYTEDKPQNFWTVDPAISKDSWLSGDDSVVLTAGMTKYGAPSATIAKDDGDPVSFDGTIPTAVGDYVITYDAAGVSGDYYLPQEHTKSVSFTILPGDEVPPFTVGMTTAPAFAVNGSQVDCSFAYAVECEVVSPKTVNVHALYWYDESETNDVLVAENAALDATGNYTIEDIAVNTNCYVCLYGVGGETYSPTTQVYTVSIPGPCEVASANAIFTNDPKEFTISGTVTPGLGATTLTVYWSLNSDAMDQSHVFNYAFGDDGTFVQVIPYAGVDDYLVWRVEVTNTFGNEEWNDGTDQRTKERTDTAAVTYTWTGAANDGLWTNVLNWSASSPSCKGYPNSYNYATVQFPAMDDPIAVLLSRNISTYAIKVAANADVTIDLNEQALNANTAETKWYGAGVGWEYVWESAEVGANAKFTLANGTWNPSSGSVQIAGNNAEVVFTNVTCAAYTDGNGAYLVNARGNSNGSVSGWKVTITGHNISAPRGIGGKGGANSKVVVDGCAFAVNSNSYVEMMALAADYIAVNGGSIVTGNGGWQAVSRSGGSYGAIGSGSTATFNLPTGDASHARGFNCHDTKFFAVDGATLTIPNYYLCFVGDPDRNNDIRNEFVCSNATINISGTQDFKFGTLGSGKCDAPTITLAGNYNSFKPVNAFFFGSSAELDHPPVLNLIPTESGFYSAAIRSTMNMTFGANVTVRLNPVELGEQRNINIARTTATLTADVDALKANTTVVGQPHWTASFKIVDVVEGANTWHTLRMRVSHNEGAMLLVR